jgi:hypothetical protein
MEIADKKMYSDKKMGGCSRKWLLHLFY